MNLSSLPPDLPVPADDGACDHLAGMALPDIALPSTAGGDINLSKLPSGLVIYFYPMTGRPDTELPAGWDEIPGARGCTPQSCAFRDHDQELRHLGYSLYGISTQTTAYQSEAVDRLHLPFSLLSDNQLRLATALRLPVFEVNGMTLIKRITLVTRDGIIKKVFYPVFPPDRNAGEVINWLTTYGDQSTPG